MGTFTPGTTKEQTTNYQVAAWEILGCLCNGGTLVIRGSDWGQTLGEVSGIDRHV
jgi:hypothetical protein